MSEIIEAFAHPEMRAAATQGDDPLDRLSLRDHEVSVEIGAFQSERGTTQRVVFNIVVELSPSTEAIEDDVDRILSYDRLTDAIATELAEERLNLLETLAERIGDRILQEPRAFRVFVRIEKLDRGPGALGVEIVRSRDRHGAGARDLSARLEQPLLVHLHDDVLEAPEFGRWLDLFAAQPFAVILTADGASLARARTAATLPQRRIDLLAIEQQAWRFAAADPRCVVRDSRTELEWAIKHRQLSLWAPSKMVLDAVDGPTGDARMLADWCGEQLGARAVLSLGGEGCDLRLDGPFALPEDVA